MKILVLSDLHIGINARGRDMCPVANDKALEDNYVNDFISYLLANSIRADYLVITGDVTCCANIGEFKLGRNLIKEIADKIDIPNNKVLIIPGNHDVDWEVLKIVKPDDEEDKVFRKGQRYDAMRTVFNDSYNIKELLAEPYYTSWEYDDLYVLGFNSAWHDEKDARTHNGFITNDIIEKLELIIKRYDLTNKIKIFITHHHLFQYSDPVSSITDVSIMKNSENLLRMLARNKFDMVAHGHKHVPHIFTQEIDSIHPISMLCAGSFSVILDQKYSGSVLNMFHIINFEGRDEETGRIYGIVESYSYSSPHKWLKSKQGNSSVLHQQGFGSYSCIDILVNELAPLVLNEYGIKGSAVWSDICKDNRRLLYHTPEFIGQLTDEIANKVGLKKYAIENEIIFIRK
jgi:3',5'-cyclic AMP phosphodiesterase CpdA